MPFIYAVRLTSTSRSPRDGPPLMGMPRHYTAVPKPGGEKKSDKLSSDARVSLIANAWDVGAFRFLFLTLAFLC